MSQQSKPDWYPDPWKQAELRYWDGQQWTHHMSSTASTSSPETQQQTPQLSPQEPAATGKRPGRLTGAAVILFVLSVLNLLTALLFASIDDADIDSGLAAGLAAFSAAIGVAQLIAGVLILRLQDRGRILGLVVSGIGIIGAVISLAQGVPSATLGLILNVVVIAFLQQHRDAFHR